MYDGTIRFGVNNTYGFESGYLQMIENDVFNSVFKEGMPEEYAAYQSVVQKLLNGEIDVGTAIGATQEYIENEKRKADPSNP